MPDTRDRAVTNANLRPGSTDIGLGPGRAVVDKATGSFPTPPFIVRFMSLLALATLREPGEVIGRGLRVLDPAVGDGRFLIEIAQRLEQIGSRWTNDNHSLTGIEIQSDRAIVARGSLTHALGTCEPQRSHWQVLTADALLDPVPTGFDLVIGNPPYLGSRYFELMPEPAAYRKRLRNAFGWADDLYTHFIFRSFELVRPGGVVCLIVPNTFLAAPSKRRLRELLLSRTLLGIVLLGPGIFPAIVYPAIILARNDPFNARDEIELVDARSLAADRLERHLGLMQVHATHIGLSTNHTPKAKGSGILGPTIATPSDGSIPVASELPADTVYRYRLSGSTFLQAPDRRFFMPSPERLGFSTLVTGATSSPLASGSFVTLERVAPARDIGIHSGNVRHNLFFARATRSGLARLLQGCQIERYIVRWDAPQARFRYVDLSYRPDPSRFGLSRGRSSRRREYWHLRGREVHEVPEKILIRQTDDDLIAAYVDQSDHVYYTDNTLFTIVIRPEALELGLTYRYLLGLLNSQILGRIYHFLAEEVGKNQAQVRVSYVNRLPIFIPTLRQRLELESLVGQVLAADEADSSGALAAIDCWAEEHYRLQLPG